MPDISGGFWIPATGTGMNAFTWTALYAKHRGHADSPDFYFIRMNGQLP